MISEQFIVGIDNTDGAGCEGTGALTMALAAEVAAAGWGEPLGVTRHQLFDSSKLSSDNGNYCYALAIQTMRSILDVEDEVVDFVRSRAARDADPGVAIMSRHSDMPHILAFGRRAQTELMKLEWAQTFADEANVSLRALGNRRDGIVGALAAAGLRGGGTDGVFIHLPAIRDLEGTVRAGEIRERTTVETILDDEGEPLDRDDRVQTNGYVRPRLEGGKPVIHTRRSAEDRHLWVVVDGRPYREPEGD